MEFVIKHRQKHAFYRDLTTAFSEFEREMLQQKSKLLRFQERIKSHRVKAQQINQMIQAHITAASATETGYFSFDYFLQRPLETRINWRTNSTQIEHRVLKINKNRSASHETIYFCWGECVQISLQFCLSF